ncbi:MAG: GNAT family N-acetyltransferase [Armatimonadaceae bacterium]
MRMPDLQTPRLQIRPVRSEDREAIERVFYEVWDSEVPANWLTWATLNPEVLAGMYQPPYGERAVVLRETDAVIGLVGLVPAFGPFGTLPGFDTDPSSRAAHRNTPEVGLYWCLLPEHRGRGYATEAADALVAFAFETLNLRRIVATTEYDNTDSLAVMQRLGMQIKRNPNPEPHWFQIIGVKEQNP